MSFGILKSLVLYLILSGIVVNFSPNANYKRYIRFFFGLLIFVLLEEPIQFVFHLGSGNINQFVAQMEHDMKSVSNTEISDTIYNYYEMGIAESIKETVLEHGVHVVKVLVLTDKNNNIVKCTVWISEPQDDKQEDFIKNIISDVYNLDVNRIYIIRR